MSEHERSRCLAFAKKLQTEANQTADEAAGHLADLRLGSESGYGEKGGRREESGRWEEKRRPEIVLKEGPSAPKPYKCVGCGQTFGSIGRLSTKAATSRAPRSRDVGLEVE